MASAFKVSNGSNIVLDNVVIHGFEKAVDAENSSLNIRNCDFQNNQVGLNLVNSPTIIYNSNLSKNGIDIFSERTPIQLIDSVVENIMIDGLNQMIRSQPVSINFNPFQLKAQAQDVINTKDPIKKRQKVRDLFNHVWSKGKDIWTLYNMLRVALKSQGIDLP